MARSENNLTAVFNDTANAIRSKKGSSEEICPRDFADEISTIETGIEPTGTYDIYDNGVYDITEYASVDVNVEGYPEPTGTIYIYENAEQVDVKDYAYANVSVYLDCLAANASDYNNNIEYTKLFGIDGGYIDEARFINNNTFVAKLSGNNFGFSIQESEGMYLSIDDEFVSSHVDGYMVKVALLKKKTTLSNVDVSDIYIDIGDFAEEEVQEFINSNYYDDKVVFIDLLENVIAEKYLRDMVGGGAS